MEIEENEVVKRLKAHIGKELSNSPSPFGAWLRGTLRKVEPGSLTIDFTVRRDMTNTALSLHGGATAAMIDDTMGMTVACLGADTFYTTINLSVDYLSAAQIGDVITVTTHINREGKNIVNIDCMVTHQEGKLIAKATSNLIKTAIPK